jgi:uncharacterized protein YndB with AHSA1/START domain
MQLSGCIDGTTASGVVQPRGCKVTDERVTSEIVVPAEATTVWSALTDADELRQWFGAEIEVDARPGGDVRARWPDGGRAVGTVEVAEPDARLAFRWRHVEGVGFGSRLGAASRVEFVLESVDGGTRIVVTEAPVEFAFVGGGAG